MIFFAFGFDGGNAVALLAVALDLINRGTYQAGWGTGNSQSFPHKPGDSLIFPCPGGIRTLGGHAVPSPFPLLEVRV